MLKVQEQEAKESCLRLQIQNVNAKSNKKELKNVMALRRLRNFFEAYGYIVS